MTMFRIVAALTSAVILSSPAAPTPVTAEMLKLAVAPVPPDPEDAAARRAFAELAEQGITRWCERRLARSVGYARLSPEERERRMHWCRSGISVSYERE